MSDAETAPAGERKGKAWSEEEDRRLYDGFLAGMSIEALVSAHHRSGGGIRSRLQKLRLVDRFGEIVDPPPPFAAPERKRAAKPEAVTMSTPVDVDRTMRPVFAMTAPDGWQVEIQSNQPLDKPLADRLAWIIRGAARPAGSASQ